jgi:3-oxoacyl-(acyl-carrier-protein) synthase
MARQAANQAIAEANWEADDYAIVIGTSKGSIERWIGARSKHMFEVPCVAGGFDPTGLGDIAAHLGRGQGAKLTISAACASGLIALIRGAMLIRSGEAKRVLVVATEASVHPLFLGSFARLGVLPAAEIGCRPFDERRDGFLMSEAAAAVCLEAAGSADRCGPQITLEKFAMGADAAHITAANPDGRVLRKLIHTVMRNAQVDLIHAHGTGTVANDPMELAAIESTLSQSSSSLPCLYSHKGALGHSLGASGLLAVVLNVMAHRQGIIPPNIRTTRPLAATKVTISPIAVHRPVNRSLVLAAGFGGSMAAVSLVTQGSSKGTIERSSDEEDDAQNRDAF